jgi:hypothetical protein
LHPGARAARLLSIWVESVRLRLDGGSDSVWVFLALADSAQKPPFPAIGFSWISLDSLVRIETFQWVTREKRAKVFSVVPLGVERVERRRSQSCLCGGAELLMGQA